MMVHLNMENKMVLEQITNDWKQALRNKDDLVKLTLSTARGAIKNAAIEKRAELDDAETIKIIQKEVKKRKDSIDAYLKVNQKEAAQKEQSEIDILMKYVPEQIDQTELRSIVFNETNKVAKVRELTQKDMGPIIKAVSARVAGRADGKMVSLIVKETIEALTN